MNMDLRMALEYSTWRHHLMKLHIHAVVVNVGEHIAEVDFKKDRCGPTGLRKCTIAELNDLKSNKLNRIEKSMTLEEVDFEQCHGDPIEYQNDGFFIEYKLALEIKEIIDQIDE